jgi:hypothetical protein
MMSKNTTARAYGVVLATMFAFLVTFVIRGFWPGMNVLITFVVFVGLWVGFFVTGIWVFTREFPITGAEHRRRSKQFYDWLRFQGRR